MNWNKYAVEKLEFEELRVNNLPIPRGNRVRPLPNAGVELHTTEGKQCNAIYDPELDAFRRINTYNPQFHSMGNRDLALYNDLLMNESVTTIIVDGVFGTGKTSTLSSHLVEGLKEALEGRSGIAKAYITKPHVVVGESYGYLPGDLHDKTAEEFKSFTQYFDRFGGPGLADLLMMRDLEKKDKFVKEKDIPTLQEPMLHVLPFEYIRGLDIEDAWMVLDETQNTSEKEAITFFSRTCDSAKVIILGDTSEAQIDKKGNTPEKNGLVVAKDIYLGTKYTGYVEMKTVSHILRGQRVKDLHKYLANKKKSN